MNLRKAFLVVAGGLATLLVLIGLVSVGALQAFSEAREGVKKRQASLTLVIETRNEVDLLGRLVSSYVSTADPRFLIYYYDILAIREGSKPFPEGRTVAYWEQVMAGMRAYEMPREGQPRPLVERISQMGFDARERDLVRQIHQLTERMKQTEQIAFAATQGLYDAVKGEFVSEGAPEPAFANQILHSPTYMTVRAELAVAIDNLAREVDGRTTRSLVQTGDILRNWIYAGLALLLLTCMVLLAAYRYLEKRLLRPLIRLHGAAAALADKSYSVRVGNVEGVEEVKVLAATVDGMAAAIESDIRKREETEAALREASRKAAEATEAKSIFLANMSHEIRTPMNAILGMAYLALKSGLPPRQHDYVSKIHGAAGSLLGIINDILDFSKIEAGKIELESRPFDIEGVVQNALFMVQQRAEERRIQLLLDYRLRPGFPMLGGDALRLGQVLINLLSNAVKFTETGHVSVDVAEIRSDADYSTLRFSVQDTGIGMTPVQVTRLFKNFSQAAESTSRIYGGTGLGLSISQRLVLAMGGEISVDSTVGRGSRFHFSITFPVVRDSARPAPEPLHCRRVLVADAYGPARESMARLFQLMGCEQVEQAVAAGEAVERMLEASCRDQAFVMLVLDWAAFGKDLNRMKAELQLANVELPLRIVAVTAGDVALVRAEAVAAGVTELIHKPLFPADLRRLCGESHQPGQSFDAPAENSGDALAGARILLVEDNEINQEVASELLRGWGASVEIANNGELGLECLLARESGYFSVVLMDLNMPVMDGHECTRRIRAEKRFTGLPILALTAHAVGPELQQALGEGMNGHITKPFDPAELLNQLLPYIRKSPSLGLPVQAVVGWSEDGFLASLSATPGIESESLLRRFKGRIPSLRRSLTRFVADAPGIFAKLETALAEGVLERAQREVHTLKGLAGTFGLVALAQAALDLESSLREGKVPERPLVAGLGEILNSTLVTLSTLLAGHAAANGQSDTASGPRKPGMP